VTGVIRKLLLATVVALLASAPSYGKAVAKTRTGPDSWLKYRVNSVGDFMAAYDQDAVLRTRLANHFHMPEEQLTSYLRSELREVTFEDSRWMGTYGVKDRTGEVYPVKTYVRKGAKALGLADGTPLIKLPCGNPFAAPPIEPPRGPRPMSKPVEPLPSIPPVGTISLEPTALQSPEEFVLGQDIPRAPIFQVPVTTEGSRFFPFWWPSGGGGGQETPEPASLLLLGAGMAVFGGLTRRRRAH